MKNNKAKYGDVIKQLFEFVKENEPVSWTEMNKFYLLNIKGQKTYDPVWDRGGSFCHHLVSMKNKSKRNYSGKVEYLIKEQGVKGKYYAYTLQGDREVLSTFAKEKQEKEITEIPTTCGNCERPATYSNKGETINRCDRCYDEGLGLQQKGSAKTTVNAISDDLFNFLGEIGALGDEAEKEYNDKQMYKRIELNSLQPPTSIYEQIPKTTMTKVRLETLISDLTNLITELEKDSLKKKYYDFENPIAEYQKDDKLIQGLFKQRGFYGEALNAYTAYQQAIKKAQNCENTITGIKIKQR